MNILIINKFLHPNGGSETYIFELGACLQRMGHRVEYFGMDHAGRCVGNRVNAYTADMDFHGGSPLAKLTYPVRTIYSAEARRQLRRVLDDFRPDVCHLNNFNYQLTPSVILELVRWRRQTGHPCRILYTAHDYQLICPNHMMYRPGDGAVCDECRRGFSACARRKCIHGSAAKSAVGAAEAMFWRRRGVYRWLDAVICCSEFMKTQLDRDPLFAGKTVAMHNFVPRPTDAENAGPSPKQDYVLYFGRFSREKGVGTLLQACRALPDIPFVFAGRGPLEAELHGLPNVRCVGFQTGGALRSLVGAAQCSVVPSEWYENCPFSVMESQICGTPVVGAAIGGIPELIEPGRTGELFASGDARALTETLRALWADRVRLLREQSACRTDRFDTVEEYCQKLMPLYTGKMPATEESR